MKQNHTAPNMLHGTWPLFNKRHGSKLLALLAALSFALPSYSQNIWLGMKFTVGNNPIQVTELGRIYVQGNSRTHTVKLVDASTGTDVAAGAVTVNMAGGAAEQFKYAALANPVTLAQNKAYYLVSEETEGGDYWHDANTSVTTGAAAVCDGPVLNTGGGFTAESGKANFSYVPLDFKYTSASSLTLRNPDNPTDVVSGLTYSYYEGSWISVPNFDAMTAVRSGEVSTFVLTPRSRNEEFGFRYTGYVDVPTDGTYTFYTTSDDGTLLSIGGTVVVNNDGQHGQREQSGSIGLKAGKHAITVGYFERGGQEVLNVSYAGPGLSKQTIPASALYRSSVANSAAPSQVSDGVYQLVARHSNKVIDVFNLNMANHAQLVQWPSLTGKNQQWQVTALGNGTYKLIVLHSNKALDAPNANEGARIQQYTDNGSNPQRWKIEPTDGGYFKLINQYSNKALQVGSNGSSDNGTAIEQGSYVGGSNQQWRLELVNSAAAAKAATSSSASAASLTSAPLSVFPNPTVDGRPTITWRAKQAQDVTLRIFNQQGTFVGLFTRSVPAGESTFRLPNTLTKGTYYLKATIDGEPQNFTLKVE